MILDDRTEFFDAIAIPTSAGTALLGDVVDLTNIRDIGNGQDIILYASVDVAGSGGTSVQLNLITDDNAAMSSPAVVVSGPVVALAALTAGRQIMQIVLPTEGVAYERYIGIQAVVVGTFAGGNISAGLMLDKKGWKSYPDAVN